MPVRHRIEVLEHTDDDRMETWSNASGSVLLVRHQGEACWKAFLDHQPVTDAELLNGGHLTRPRSALMVSPDCADLARRLALQEHIHVVFD